MSDWSYQGALIVRGLWEIQHVFEDLNIEQFLHEHLNFFQVFFSISIMIIKFLVSSNLLGTLNIGSVGIRMSNHFSGFYRCWYYAKNYVFEGNNLF